MSLEYSSRMSAALCVKKRGKQNFHLRNLQIFSPPTDENPVLHMKTYTCLNITVSKINNFKY